MNKGVLEKDISIVENQIVITQKTEEKLTLEMLHGKLRGLETQKQRTKAQNKAFVQEYRRLEKEEQEVLQLIAKLEPSEEIEEL